MNRNLFNRFYCELSAILLLGTRSVNALIADYAIDKVGVSAASLPKSFWREEFGCACQATIVKCKDAGFDV